MGSIKDKKTKVVASKAPGGLPAKVSHKYINREISWLSFNERVLQEAADPSVPLNERLRFLGIYSSNLDEFFRVRVGTLKRMVKAGIKGEGEFSGSPKKTLAKIQEIVIGQRQKFDQIFTDLNRELEKERIFILNEKELNEHQERFVHDYFVQEVRPTLVPVMLDSVSQFPYLKNQVIYLVINMSRNEDPQNVKYALIEVPADLLPRFILLPSIGRNKYIIMLDDVIRFRLPDIFAIFEFDRFDAYTIKLTRDAELEIEDDVIHSLFEKISKSVKQRVTGQPVRFVYDREVPQKLLDFVLEQTNLKKFDNIIPGGRYHNARDFIKFPNVGLSRLEYAKQPSLPHPAIAKHRSLFEAIRERDILLHYPYQSFQYTIDLLREAAIDPKVTSIHMTLYRVAKHSNVVNALINAMRNGKSVSVLLELKARFDEEANIHWTQQLEEEGAHMLESVPGLKVHAKLCLITRKEGKKQSRYAIVGTGNFNESTAKIYSDHALFTANKAITREVAHVFEFLNDHYKTHSYKHLFVSPFCMRKKIQKLIKNEIKNAKGGKEAYIYLKLNNLVDPRLIGKLYEASQAGVQIKMVIRGICSLVAGVEGFSENIEAVSIVDKYLEHSRMFIFCNAGDEKYYISSGDWMGRNLDNRVEVAVPIYDKTLQQELKGYSSIQLQDNQKARIINQDLNNTYRNGVADVQLRAQEETFTFLNRTYSSYAENAAAIDTD